MPVGKPAIHVTPTFVSAHTPSPDEKARGEPRAVSEMVNGFCAKRIKAANVARRRVGLNTSLPHPSNQ